MKNTQEGLTTAAAVIFIVLVLLIIAGGGYYIWQQQQKSNAQISAFNNQFSSSSVSTSPNVSSATSSVSETDQVQINNNVTSLLNAYRSASDLQDIQNLMSMYASEAQIQQFQAAISKIPSSSVASFQTELITIAHAYPDPTSLQFITIVNGNYATTTAQLPTTVSTSTENFNNKPGGIITTTSHNTLFVNLDKEDGQWKVNRVTISSKSVGVQSNNQ